MSASLPTQVLSATAPTRRTGPFSRSTGHGPITATSFRTAICSTRSSTANAARSAVSRSAIPYRARRNILSGWGKREYNWEGSVSVQHQLRSNVSAEVGYFRRWYGNFLVTDNLAVAPTDFESFSVVAPSDSRLPGGGAQRIGGLYDVVPTRFGQTNNLLTF